MINIAIIEHYSFLHEYCETMTDVFTFQIMGNKTLHFNATGNKTFILKNKVIQNEHIILEDIGVSIYNCSFENTTLMIKGNNSNSVLMAESSFYGSEVIVNSTEYCTIEYCSFETDKLVQHQQKKYILTVYSVQYLIITHTLFGSVAQRENITEPKKRDESSQLGIRMKNVLLAEMKSCTFSNIVAGNSNGSAMHLIDSSTSIISCDFHANSGHFGTIYGNSFANITCINSTFTSNYASMYGGVFYLENHIILQNIDSKFQNNTAGLNGGVIYGLDSVLNENENCLFQYNIDSGHGGVIYVRDNSHVINEKVSQLRWTIRDALHTHAPL